MFELDFRQPVHALAVLGVIDALIDARARCFGDFHGTISAE